MALNVQHIALEIKPSPLLNVKFIEAVDCKMLIKMLASDKIIKITETKDTCGHKKFYKNERNFIVELLKKACVNQSTRVAITKAVHGNIPFHQSVFPKLFHHAEKYFKSCIEVRYFYDQHKKIGRVYPEGSLSLCCIRRELRHHLCKDKYIDIDMINAHFKIADEIFNKNAIRFPILHDYVMNRERYLAAVSSHFSIDGYCNLIDYKTPDGYDEIKNLFIRILYYGKYESWRDELGLPKIQAPKFLTTLKKEFDQIAEIIKENNPSFLELIPADKENVNGTIVSWFLQEHERRILEVAYQFLCKEKQIKKKDCVLCFDGIMIKDITTNNNMEFLGTLLSKMTEFIRKTLGLNIDFKVKEFDKLVYEEELNKIEIEYVDDDLTIIDNHNDNQASDIIYERLKGELVYCKNQLYAKIDNIWEVNIKLVDNYLLTYVMNSNIHTTTESGTLRCYSQSVSNARNIIAALKAKVSENANDAMYHLFHKTTIGKLCFADGVLFIKENKFIKWEDPYFNEEKNKIYSTICIKRNFADVFYCTGEEKFKLDNTMNFMKNKLFDGIFNEEQSTLMLQFLSRAMFGYYEDKDWGLWLGSRNCGKGTLNTLLSTAFEGYITNVPSQCLMYHKFSSSDTKQNSWLLDLQYPRLALAQELQKDKNNKDGCKINGTVIKSICSGGDPQKTRKNYCDEVDFIIGCKMMILANDLPRVEPADVFETCIQFNSGKQFKTADFIHNKQIELNELLEGETNEEKRVSILSELDKYLLCDDELKTNCQTIEWANAFIMLLVQYFRDRKLEPSNDKDIKDDDTIDVNEVLNEMFIFTKNEKDRIPTSQLEKYWRASGLDINKSVFKNELVARGCADFKSGSVRYIKYIKQNPDFTLE